MREEISMCLCQLFWPTQCYEAYELLLASKLKTPATDWFTLHKRNFNIENVLLTIWNTMRAHQMNLTKILCVQTYGQTLVIVDS